MPTAATRVESLALSEGPHIDHDRCRTGEVARRVVERQLRQAAVAECTVDLGRGGDPTHSVEVPGVDEGSDCRVERAAGHRAEGV